MDSLTYSPFEAEENSPENALPPEFTDDALARKFTEQYRNELLYTAQWSKWNFWDGRRWLHDSTLSVFDRARGVCRSAASVCDDKRLAQRIASAQTVSAVERLARADQGHAMRPEQWDADPWKLNTPGGIVDLRTGALQASRSSAYCSLMTAVGPGGDCPRWLGFLDRATGGDDALEAFIRRMCGYALTGETREHALFFLFGTGANGKSVFLSTISGLMGEYAKTAPIDTFTETKFTGHPTELAYLRGARLVTATETGDGARWNEARIKILTGGDKVSARFMHGDFFEYTPAFKLVIAGNHRPSLRTVDEAMRRRFRLLPFTTTIPEAERDPRLIEHLRVEWPGILRWAIDGCLEWQRSGLSAPEAVQEASLDYMQAEDVLQQWIEERCEVSPGAWSASSDLFASWQKYAESCGEFAGNQKRFAERMTSHGFKLHRTMSARGFTGIRLRHDA
jgi:putative DNA primase/helicase